MISKPRKSLMVLSIIMMMVISTPLTTYGADALYRMLYADEVASFAEDQDAIALFEVVEVDDDFITGKVLKVISGNVDRDEILIKKEGIRILSMQHEPDLLLGDYCVMSIKQYGDHYEQAWLALKADSGDYQTLKFYYAMHFSDIDALQFYVNSGGVEKDFHFNESKVFVTLSDGTEKDITLSSTPYLPEKDEPDVVVVEATDDDNSLEVTHETEEPEEQQSLIMLSVTTGIIVLVIGSIITVIYVKSRGTR